ncbi:MAG: hypothetical protein U0183_09540 [Polyangiaceae bacterium]
MRRIAPILAHVLATTSLAACGGKVDEGSAPGPTLQVPTATASTPPTPTPVPTPVPTPTSTHPPPIPDAGCTTPVQKVRGDGACTDVFHHACGVPEGVDPTDGMSPAECAKVCPQADNGRQYYSCSAYLKDDLPGPSFECYSCVEGRRPEGYVEPRAEATVAGWLAHAADLERVSIDAFRILHRELSHYGAPEALLLASLRAEADEVVHARMMGNLAVREGATLSSTPVPHGEVRALVDIALENAVEGCVRETYGAVVAGYQAAHAARVDVRKLMDRVYRDECAHAELAWSVHAFLLPKLSSDERARVEAAMDAAVRELHASADAQVPYEVRSPLGLPDGAEAKRLVRGLKIHLFLREPIAA